MNSASCRANSRSWSVSAPAWSPAAIAAWNAAHSRGAQLAVTEMQPIPPRALNASASSSLPDSWTNPSPSAARCRDTLASAPEASLMPMKVRGNAWTIRTTVAGRMSVTVRAGTL